MLILVSNNALTTQVATSTHLFFGFSTFPYKLLLHALLFSRKKICFIESLFFLKKYLLLEQLKTVTL
jgi:hypothetical protein